MDITLLLLPNQLFNEKYLPKDERALYNARQILMSNSYGVDNAISKVPAHLKNNPGLEFDRLRWRNRRGRLEGSLEILYKNFGFKN